MGTYSGFVMTSKLRADAPQHVVDILSGLIARSEPPEIESPPDHPFFRCARWGQIGANLYGWKWPGEPDGFSISQACAGGGMDFTVRSIQRNDDREFDKFVDWISPFLDATDGDVIAQMQSEVAYGPTFYIFGGRKISWGDVRGDLGAWPSDRGGRSGCDCDR